MTVTEPEIISVRREGDTARLALRIPKDLSYFRGHFAEIPLLPGVVQVDWAILLARQQFDIPAHFKRLSALKFMRVLSPGSEPELVLNWRASNHELEFRYEAGESLFSSGRVLFAAA